MDSLARTRSYPIKQLYVSTVFLSFCGWQSYHIILIWNNNSRKTSGNENDERRLELSNFEGKFEALSLIIN